MTLEERITQLEGIVLQLVKAANSLEDTGSISHEVEAALRNRLFGVSKSTIANHSAIINESGSNSTTVALPMTGFMTVKDDNGVTRNIAYYD